MSADHIFLVGRILLGGMFVVAGLWHLMIVPKAKSGSRSPTPSRRTSD